MPIDEYLKCAFLMVGTGIIFGIWQKEFWAGAFMVNLFMLIFYVSDKFFSLAK